MGKIRKIVSMALILCMGFSIIMAENGTKSTAEMIRTTEPDSKFNAYVTEIQPMIEV